MIGLWLSIIFVVSLFVGEVLMPAFLGAFDNYLIFIFLLAGLIYFNSQRNFFVIGLVFSFITEWSFGFRFGTLILPFVLCAIILYALSNFFDLVSIRLRSRGIFTPLIFAFLGVVLLVVYLFGVEISKIINGSNANWGELAKTFSFSWSWLYSWLFFVFYFFIYRFVAFAPLKK